MTQEQKDLLLKDLCARLPYKVYAQIPNEYGGYTSAIESIDIDGFVTDFEGAQIEIENIKPYLLPLSSMTEEQKKEFKEISNCEYVIRDYSGFDSEGVYLIEIGKYEYEYDTDTTVEKFYFNYSVIDWFNKNHFDWRGLIEKSLALDVTGLNIY